MSILKEWMERQHFMMPADIVIPLELRSWSPMVLDVILETSQE
jgi:hypothetical protein